MAEKLPDSEQESQIEKQGETTYVEFGISEQSAKKLREDIESGEIDRLFGGKILAFVFDEDAEA